MVITWVYAIERILILATSIAIEWIAARGLLTQSLAIGMLTLCEARKRANIVGGGDCVPRGVFYAFGKLGRIGANRATKFGGTVAEVLLYLNSIEAHLVSASEQFSTAFIYHVIWVVFGASSEYLRRAALLVSRVPRVVRSLSAPVSAQIFESPGLNCKENFCLYSGKPRPKNLTEDPKNLPRAKWRFLGF